MIKFLKEHYILSILFVISILLMIKSSSIPYFIEPPTFVSFIFDSPKSEFWKGIFQFVDIFASAYVTSLIFYVMVDYIPSKQREKQSKQIVDAKLVSIYSYLSEFLSMIDYSAEIANTSDNLDEVVFNNEMVNCKHTTLKNGIEHSTITYSYTLLKDCNKYKDVILDSARSLSGVLSFSYCDSEIIDVISEIQLIDLFQIIPPANEYYLNTQNIAPACIGTNEDCKKLKSLKDKLGKHISIRWDYQNHSISEEELAESMEKQVKTLMENPEIVKLIIENLKGNL